jgi:hypothetical protein
VLHFRRLDGVGRKTASKMCAEFSAADGRTTCAIHGSILTSLPEVVYFNSQTGELSI